MNFSHYVLLPGLLIFLGNKSMAQPSNNNVLPAINLVCPFEHGAGREPKEAFTYSPPDKKVIMISQQDTIVRSCTAARVTNVAPAEDNHYEIVINSGNMYYWYYAVMKPLVTKGQALSPGQALAVYTLGTELEFRMFQNEDMQDPRNLLECKVPKATD